MLGAWVENFQWQKNKENKMFLMVIYLRMELQIKRFIPTLEKYDLSDYGLKAISYRLKNT